jgi:hypothetical protein
MPKTRTVLRVDIPHYPEKGQRLDPDKAKRLGWRQAIHEEAIAARDDRGLRYKPETPVEVQVVFYLSDSQMRFHDLDNPDKGRLRCTSGKARWRGEVVPDT